MSLVRLCCESYRVPEDKKPLLVDFWPQFKAEKYFSCDEKIIDLADVPDEIVDIDGVSIKPLKTVKFVRPAPNFVPKNIDEVREFVKTVNQIVVPGFELLRYSAIKVHTNECTEEIQSCLDDGWRIIAVLPQPDQRRPDYILVREHKP